MNSVKTEIDVHLYIRRLSVSNENGIKIHEPGKRKKMRKSFDKYEVSELWVTQPPSLGVYLGGI